MRTKSPGQRVGLRAVALVAATAAYASCGGSTIVGEAVDAATAVRDAAAEAGTNGCPSNGSPLPAAGDP
ncbi:MAG TPA: hypothetical protein VK762_20935, partial [Polyangiaceae bacterium]|nr:hypothetical protein [Polyangiaceae bacterium]